MAGWWLGAVALTSTLPDWPAMKPATALLCLLDGAALWLLAPPAARPRARAAGLALVSLGAALALLTLVQHAFGLGLGIDRLLTGRRVGPPVARTAVAFLLISAALASIVRVSPRAPPRSAAHVRVTAQLLVLVAASIALVALLGYVFGLPVLHGSSGDAAAGGMAFQTAVALVLLASGVLAARPSEGLMAALTSPHAGGMAARRLLLALLAFDALSVVVVVGRNLGLYRDAAVAPLLVFLGLAGSVALISSSPFVSTATTSGTRAPRRCCARASSGCASSSERRRTGSSSRTSRGVIPTSTTPAASCWGYRARRSSAGPSWISFGPRRSDAWSATGPSCWRAGRPLASGSCGDATAPGSPSR